MAETKTRLPFHESIVVAIEDAPSLQVLAALGELIKRTNVPKNHLSIVAAYALLGGEFGMGYDVSIVENLAEQEREAEARITAAREKLDAEMAARDCGEPCLFE